MSARADLVVVFLRWTWWRAVLHNGWWLVTSAYLVVDAGLSSSQLVLIGAAQAAVGLAFEVPAGVVADTISRKWALVVSHGLMGTAMIATAFVTDFGLIVATQMLWGLAWTFASGADVAWITDELDQPARISVVLMRSGRAQLTGAAAGIVGIGALGALTERSTAMIVAGVAMLLLGLFVVIRFDEHRFARAHAEARPALRSVLLEGWALVRRSRAISIMLAATFLVNGAGAFGRLQPRRLVDLRLPTDPVVWFTGLGFLTLLVGAVAMRVTEPHVDDARTALRGYGIACVLGAAGLVVFAAAPEEVSASAAVLVVAGIARPLTLTLATIWVNRQTSSDVRATVHSFLAQAEYLGVIVCGLSVALVAWVAGVSAALVACAALFAIAIVPIRRLGNTRAAVVAAHAR